MNRKENPASKDPDKEEMRCYYVERIWELEMELGNLCPEREEIRDVPTPADKSAIRWLNREIGQLKAQIEKAKENLANL